MTAIIKDIPFNYEEYGTGKPVLCIHGYLVDHRMMKNCFEPVFKLLKNYRRIYIDLPGIGRTPAANYIKTAYDTLKLLIVGFNDVYELLNIFPRASYSVIDCAGHNLQIENGKVFTVFLRDWIKRIEMEMEYG